ncbi:hypothetical protein SAY87_003034 [Trapa incisa]|uniref:USP domain-containing protein n=1 Tax=Trapa incisa TaxID=236973 RepID=A0AAN7KF19_9MYRT|nr:hypothetical protein SAY87_003034 [Trapa incisa]
MLQINFEAVLRKRTEDLIGDEHYDAFSCSSYELEAINNVLREAAAFRSNLFGDEDAYGNPSSDMNSSENIDGREQEFLRQMNGFIEVTMQKQEEESLLEASRIIEHLHSPEKNVPDSFTVPADGNLPDSQKDSSMPNDELKEQKEEVRRMELAVYARKIDEALEYQRRIENEAKQRQLAEQEKKLVQTHSEKTSDAFSDVARDPSDDHNKTQLNPSTQASVSDGGFPHDTSISSVRKTRRRRRRRKGSPKLIEGNSQLSSHSGKENAGAWSNEGLSQDNTYQNVDPLLEDYFSTKTLKELHEGKDDEKFQAEEIEAVQKSLGTFHSHEQMSSLACAVQETAEVAKDAGSTNCKPASATTDGSNAVGVGLQNKIGDYNCFLNVILQSLWHLRYFREEFLERSTTYHAHVGDPCAICALIEVFHELSSAADDTGNEAVAPTSLRIALSNLYPDSNFFQKGQMNDASEVLGVIFDHLHQSFTQPFGTSGDESVESSAEGSYDCKDSNACLVHSLFGMYISEKMICGCGLVSRCLEYTSFFHNINAYSLRTTKKLMPTDCSLDYLIDLVWRSDQRVCDPESGGCGQLNHIHHFLSSRPQVFIAVIGWVKIDESAEDIAATLATLSTEIDMSVFYCGLDPKQIHSLVSVVCYVGLHYCCFAYNHEIDQWIMYDDTNVKVIGSWTDLLNMCEGGRMQPQLLFFEAVK